MTEWRSLDWLPGYKISEGGDVRGPSGRILSGGIISSGYKKINVRVNGLDQQPLVHRLVCEAFHGPPPFVGAHVAHWDGDGSNNHFANLRWATAKENGEDRVRHGRSRRGEEIHQAVLTWSDVQRIRTEHTGSRGQQTRLAERFGVSSSTIGRVVRNECWRERAA